MVPLGKSLMYMCNNARPPSFSQTPLSLRPRSHVSSKGISSVIIIHNISFHSNLVRTSVLGFIPRIFYTQAVYTAAYCLEPSVFLAEVRGACRVPSGSSGSQQNSAGPGCHSRGRWWRVEVARRGAEKKR